MPDEKQSMDSHMPAPTPMVMPSSGGLFLKRELNGASFLSLEHLGHMLLVVVVAALVVMGIASAISMWTGSSLISMPTFRGLLDLEPVTLEALASISIVASLMVLVPLLVVLDRRTRAEWMKRRGYSGRLAYKIPVYMALGLLITAKLMADIVMVGVVVSSLVQIGVTNSMIGTMYLTQFVPAFIAAVVFGLAAWYVFKLAKGRDMGKQFSALMAVLSTALVVALLITAVTVLHANNPSSNMPGYDDYGNGKSLQDFFKY
jgi:hypothetical protein